MIKFENVSKHYDQKKPALHHLNFEMESGEMAFLTGHSGAGKSTLLKLIMMIERCSRGEITVSGQRLSKLSKRKTPAHRQNIGVIFQDPKLLASHTVFDNVAIPLLIARFTHQEIARRVRAALEMVGLLDKINAYPTALSSGEQQRVGIARAIINKPKILLADEPTGNLDPKLSIEIMKTFEKFNDVGVTVLIATHDLALISTMNHRMLTLNQGRLD